MTEEKYRELIYQIEAQIADSDFAERAKLRMHLTEIRAQAEQEGVRLMSPGRRPDADRHDDQLEDMFDNMPV